MEAVLQSVVLAACSVLLATASCRFLEHKTASGPRWVDGALRQLQQTSQSLSVSHNNCRFNHHVKLS